MRKFLILSMFVCLLSSCEDSSSGGNGSSSNGVERSFGTLNIAADVHTLYVAPRNSTRHSMRSSNINVLHSINNAGATAEVPFFDKNGIQVSVEVNYVVNVNDDFILMSYRDDMGSDIVLSNKRNGEVHSLKNAGYPSIWPDEETPYFTATEDFLYFVPNSGYFRQVDLRSMNVRNMNIDQDNGRVLTQQPFLVDKDGNAAYMVQGDWSYFRFRTADMTNYDTITDKLLFLLWGKIFAGSGRNMSSFYVNEGGEILRNESYYLPAELYIGQHTTIISISNTQKTLIPQLDNTGKCRIFEIT